METLLFILVGVLGIIAIVQAVRVFEISARVKGDDENKVSDKDNRTQGLLLLLFLFFFLGAFAWMVYSWDSVILPKAASLHGADIDSLWAISMGVIIVAFLVTQPLLFGFSFLFRGSKKRRAVYMEHNNKLELFWTGVPAVVLAGLILYGLTTWSETMNPSPEDEPLVVEVYGYQFNWKARYSGTDNKLGYANVRLIEGVNQLGLDVNDVSSLDDKVTNVLHLPVDRPVMLKFRAQDVIHSAYMPHFRVQMNAVPGTETQFQFEPTMTTAEMRQDPEVVEKVKNINELRSAQGKDLYEFDYMLLCNKICGSAHYNMNMKVVVQTQEQFDKWLQEQKSFAETL